MKMISVFTVAALFVLVFAACSTTNITTNHSGWSDSATIPVKDFESLGVVVVEARETLKLGPLSLFKSYTGSRITYSDLLAEAQKLGADDVINVRIDTRTETEHTLLDFFTGWTATYFYTGTALAVKYTGLAGVPRSGNQAGIDTGTPHPPAMPD
jgi:hypothetical protein